MDELKSRQKKLDDDKNPAEEKISVEEDFSAKEKTDGDFSGFLRMYGKYMILAAIAIVVVIIVILVVSKSKENTEDTEATESVAPTESESAETIAPELPGGTLEKDTNQAVGTLANAYFAAVQNCDMEALATIVDSTDSISVEQLEAEREFVEGYQNISCYTLNGLTEGTYVVYVAYDMKFLNVETPAPCLIRLYICTNSEGGLYIFNQENGMDSAVVSYMEEINAREDVKALINGVDARLTEAMAADEALNALVSKLYGNTPGENDGQSEIPEETEAPTEEPETEAPSADSGSFTEVDETVYAKEAVKIRKSPVSDAEVVGTIQAGESVQRTGYNDSWSRVKYGGETCYIAAGFLTLTEPGAGGGFTEVDERVYAKESVRVRKSPEEGAEVVGTLLEGESLKRTGYNDEWSRVIYEGETCYIGAGFLTTADPSADD